MASSVHIPDHHKRLFMRLVRVSPEDLVRLPKLLAESPTTWSPEALAQQVSEESGLEITVVRAAITIAVSLLATTEGTRIQDLPSAVAEGAAEHIDEIASDPDAVARLKAFLTSILQDPGNLGVTTKVRGVAFDHERIFLDARILTDVRPIFGDSDAMEIVGTVAVHSLRITAQENGEDRAFFFALDRDDLMKMREMVERAIKKEQVVRGRLDDAGLAFIDMSWPDNG